MLNQNGIVSMNDENTCMCFMNRFAMNEYWNLFDKVISHMVEDLSTITGLKKEDILNDYIQINDYNPIKDILQQQGQWDSNNDISRVMRVMRRKIKE